MWNTVPANAAVEARLRRDAKRGRGAKALPVRPWMPLVLRLQGGGDPERLQLLPFSGQSAKTRVGHCVFSFSFGLLGSGLCSGLASLRLRLLRLNLECTAIQLRVLMAQGRVPGREGEQVCEEDI